MENLFQNLIPEIEYFVERQCLPDWKLNRATLPYYDLTYVYSGKATYLVNDVPYVLGEGDFVFIPKGAVRQAFTDSERPMHCFAFNFQYDNTVCQHLELQFPDTFHIDDFEILDLYKEFTAIWLAKNDEYMFKAKAVFMLILHKLITYAKSGFVRSEDKRIKLLKDYIIKNHRNKIDNETLSQITNLNTVYMGNLFKRKTGMTIKEYINKVRVEAAKALLYTGGYSVADAGYQSGFDDPFYFSKVFKKITGRNPSSLLGGS